MSTNMQLKGDSLRRQLEQSRVYAREHDLDLDEDFRLQDLGVSAFNGANVAGGALGRFLEAIRSNEVEAGSHLILESLDRLSRQQVMKSLGLFTEIINAGINIVTLVDGKLKHSERSNVAAGNSAFYESKEEIKALIDHLQEKGSTDDIYRLRSQVSARIKSLVSEIRVAPAGPEIDGADKPRYFAVVFQDRTVLAVYPSEDDPLDFDQKHWTTV